MLAVGHVTQGETTAAHRFCNDFGRANPCSRQAVLFSFLNDPFVEAIAKRCRTVIARQPGSPHAIAATLSLPIDALQGFLNPEERRIDTVFLIDLVAGLVRECGIDPKWLLTGEYDGEMHRKALLLGEDRGGHGARSIRELVLQEFGELRQSKHFFALPMLSDSSIGKGKR